ncbi:MAG: fluoride efflux transporter CrcB [Salinisphaera sp.]|nr:fluoride efflux transporter CrcB [Salinisphaera sp.]
MTGLLLVGVGGFLGSIARYKLGDLVTHLAGPARFAYGTLTVNILGCLVIGLLAGLAERYNLFGAGTRLFLFTGLLGGFTTFSTFGLDAMLLMRRGELWMAALYAGASVVLGIAAVWLGFKFILMAAR